MEMKKILWPTDFSENAESALPYVESLGEKYQTEVHVLYVIPELGEHEPWYGTFDRSHIDKIHAWEEKTAQNRLNEVCDNHLQGCKLYIKHVALGDPAETILKMVEDEKIDMVVMASHGRKGSFHYGSVAEKVIKNSSVPVVTVPINQN